MQQQNQITINNKVGSTIDKVTASLFNKTNNLSIVFAVALLWLLALPTAASAQASSWRAEYFNSPTLSGSPVMVRDESEINYDWRWQSPIPGTVNNDYFSARWSRTIDLVPGNYRFTLRVDDGARLYVAGSVLIDAWREQPATSYNADIYLYGGPTTLQVDYFDNSGEAVIQLNWQMLDQQGNGIANAPAAPTAIVLPPTPTATPLPTNPSPANPSPANPVKSPVVPSIPIGTPPPPREQPRLLIANWRAEYFNNTSLSGSPILVRNESQIDQNWGSAAPLPKDITKDMVADNFSVRWTALIDFKVTRYRFTTSTDEFVRLYIDGKLVIDRWQQGQAGQSSYDMEFFSGGAQPHNAGSHKIVLEYVDRSGNATARLLVQEARIFIGNLITCVGNSGKVGVKLYRLDSKNQWYRVGGGFSLPNDAGTLKLDALPIDTERFGAGEPYRIERWSDGQFVQSIGNYQAGEPEFLLRGGDNVTPWGCPP